VKLDGVEQNKYFIPLFGYFFFKKEQS
jgi:hypothetical protein